MSPSVVGDPTDSELVDRCRGGESSAWDELVGRHGALVWSVLLRAGLSRDDAADAFQSTWTVALEELHRLREPSRVAPWLARVARHQAMRIRRRYGIARKAREHVAREDIDAHVPDEDLLRIERAAVVRRALASVGKRCADLLRALYLGDERPAYEVVSRSLGMPIGSIGPTRARCLAKLRDRLEGRDV